MVSVVVSARGAAHGVEPEREVLTFGRHLHHDGARAGALALPHEQTSGVVGGERDAAVRVYRAREALRRQVVSSCGTCAEHGCLDCTCQPTQPR